MSRSTLKDKTVDKRIPLKRNTKITLCIDASLNKTYVIDKYMGCGGFALTYVAHEKGNYPIEYVVLKEFYPCWEDMGRNENNGIIFSDKENPHSLCHSFFDHETEMTELASKIYDKSGTETMQNNPEVFSFKGPYISDNGNFYCIINTVAGEPFENFVDECRGENGKNYRLEKIFDIFIKVAKQLSSLHGDKKMYHLDLSFSNIYLVKMQGGTEIHPFIIDYGSSCVK
jgi:serine/threonine protein kinase